MKSHDQIIKALEGLVPEVQQKEITEAISTFVEDATKELDQEYDAKIKDAYKKVHEDKLKNEQVAEEGYAQAWGIITDLRNRLEKQKEEFDQSLEKGYEEAYQMLQEERAKNDTVEVDLYEEYDKKLSDIKEFLVDKVDQFLQTQGQKYHEMAKREVLNDPALAEHKVAFEKILEVAADYLSDEDYALATGSKIQILEKTMDEQKAQMKLLEAKNMRLATDNHKLNEAVRHQQEVLTEQTQKVEKKERIGKAKKAEGRGQAFTERQVVIGEQTDEAATTDREETLIESNDSVVKNWRYLSGLEKPSEEDA